MSGPQFDAGDPSDPDELPDGPGLREDVYGDSPTPFLRQARKMTFESIHKPRKSWVRAKQWNRIMFSLADELSMSGVGYTFRYLTLPGDDFLDVRALYDGLRPLNILLRYVGVNAFESGSQRETDARISEASVMRLPKMDGASVLLVDRFEKIIAEKSLLRENILRRHLPFHAVNLDLYDSVLASAGNDFRYYLESLRAVIARQFETAGHPWLLFVTSRTLAGQMSQRTRDAMSQAIARNIVLYDEFRDAAASLLGVTAAEVVPILSAPEKLDRVTYSRFTALGFAKWLLRIGLGCSRPWTVRVLDSAYYSVDGAGPDMLSLAFRFEPGPIRVTDTTGLTHNPRPGKLPSELDSALGLIGPIAAMTDLDALMADDKTLCAELIEASVKYMDDAGYDVDAYRRWALERCESNAKGTGDS